MACDWGHSGLICLPLPAQPPVSTSTGVCADCWPLLGMIAQRSLAHFLYQTRGNTWHRVPAPWPFTCHEIVTQDAEQCCHLVGISSPLGVQPGRFFGRGNKVEGHHGSTGLFLPLPVQVHDAPLSQDQRSLGLSLKTRGRLGNTVDGEVIKA